MAYNNQRKYQKDESLEWIKRNIEIGPFLKDRGWQKDKENSTQKEETLINPLTGEKILVPVYPEANGHRVWSFKKNPEKGDTLVGLLQKEGWTWKEIRDLAKDQVLSPVNIPTSTHTTPPNKPKFSSQEAKRLAQEKLNSIQPATEKDFLLTRGIKKETHIFLQGLKVSRKEAGFELYQNFNKKGEGNFCSTIIYKTDQEGHRKKYFQQDLERGLSVLMDCNKKLSEVERIVVTESPIDALSYLELEKEGRLRQNKEEEIKSTAFLSTCGSLTEQIKKDLSVVFEMAKERNQTVVLALDNDPKGKEMTEILASIAQAAKCSYEIDMPTIGKDWNDQLVSKEKRNEKQIKQILEKEEKMGKNKEMQIAEFEKEGEQVTQINESGQTLLHGARSAAAVKDLLKKGAEVNAKDSAERTPLHLAANYGRKEVAEALIQAGADINAKDKDGRTPLHWAVDMGNKEIAEFLLDMGADKDIKNNNKATPLHEAALILSKKEIAELLIKHGADVNAQDKDGYTPLHMAAYSNKEVAKLLIDYGAKVNIQDSKGNTPTHYAAKMNKIEITKLLIKAGAALDITNRLGRNPIKMATGSNRDCSHNKVIELLYQAMQAQNPTRDTGKSSEVGMEI